MEKLRTALRLEKFIDSKVVDFVITKWHSLKFASKKNRFHFVFTIRLHWIGYNVSDRKRIGMMGVRSQFKLKIDLMIVIVEKILKAFAWGEKPSVHVSFRNNVHRRKISYEKWENGIKIKWMCNHLLHNKTTKPETCQTAQMTFHLAQCCCDFRMKPASVRKRKKILWIIECTTNCTLSIPISYSRMAHLYVNAYFEWGFFLLPLPSQWHGFLSLQATYHNKFTMRPLLSCWNLVMRCQTITDTTPSLFVSRGFEIVESRTKW